MALVCLLSVERPRLFLVYFLESKLHLHDCNLILARKWTSLSQEDGGRVVDQSP